MVKMPDFLTCSVPTSARLLMPLVARASAMAPLVMTVAFIAAFMGAMMVTGVAV